jgi:hypothetical protein
VTRQNAGTGWFRDEEVTRHDRSPRVEQLRLLVLKAAWLMDPAGKRAAHTEIQAIQVHGAGGLSQDLPLASAFTGIRTLRFADGPDEVHKNAPGPSRPGSAPRGLRRAVPPAAA